MSQYEVFSSPTGFDFVGMTGSQAKRHFEHYLAHIPGRIRLLQEEIRRSPGFELWSADNSDLSVAGLSMWLKEHARGREVADDELAQARASIKGPLRDVLPESTVTMTPRTWSYCVDSAMYVGEVLRRRLPEVAWQIGPKPKRGLYYNRPVLATADGQFMWDVDWSISAFVQEYVQAARPFDLLEFLRDLENRVRKRR